MMVVLWTGKVPLLRLVTCEAGHTLEGRKTAAAIQVHWLVPDPSDPSPSSRDDVGGCGAEPFSRSSGQGEVQNLCVFGAVSASTWFIVVNDVEEKKPPFDGRRNSFPILNQTVSGRPCNSATYVTSINLNSKLSGLSGSGDFGLVG